MPGSKKAKPFASRKQARKLHAMAARGEISKAEVHRKDEATKRKKGGFKKLPEKKTAGNTDYTPSKVGTGVQSNGKVWENDITTNIVHGDALSTLTEVPGTSTSQVKETKVKIGNKVPEGY